MTYVTSEDFLLLFSWIVLMKRTNYDPVDRW